MIGPTCPNCDRIHAGAETTAVGRFRPEGPIGFIAADVPQPVVRETRAEAVRDSCEWWARKRPNRGCDEPEVQA